MLSHPQTPRPRPPNFSRARSSTNRRQPSVSGTPKPSSSLATMTLYTRKTDEDDEAIGPSPAGVVAVSPTKTRSTLPPASSSLQLTGVPFPITDNTPPHLSLQLPPPPYPSSPPSGAQSPSSAAEGASQVREPSTSPAASQKSPQGENRNAVAVGVVVDAVGAGVTKEWVQGKTREELDSLLLEADRVIRLREAELTEAAIYGQKLAKENIDLRNRRESVLQSIPRNTVANTPTRRTPRPSLTTAASWLTDNGDDVQAARDAEEREEGFSPSRTPTSTFGRSASKMMRGGSSSSGAGDPGWVFGRGSSRQSLGGGRRDSISSSMAPTPTASTFGGTHSPPRGKRLAALSISSPHRRAPSLSASPQAVIFLREQNDELLHQFEQLQIEATDADHEGKKRLRKLEKEIGALRAQLEGLEGVNVELNEKNEQLEQKLHRKGAAGGSDGGSGEKHDGGWGERRRLRQEREWEEKSRQYGGLAVSSSTPVMPSLQRHGSTPSAGQRRTPSPTAHLQQHPHRSPSTNSTSSTLSPPASPRSRSISLLGPSLSSQTSPLRQSSTGLTPSPSVHGDSARPRSAAELAVVTQLLGKMRELESVDEHFRIKREDHARRLSRAQREEAHLAGVYTALEGDLSRAGLEIVDVPYQEPVRRRGSDSATLGLPRTPSRQMGAAARTREGSPLDRTNASTPNKSPSTAALQLNFFSTSPSSASNLNLAPSSASRSPSGSATPLRRTSPHQQPQHEQKSTAPPSPSSSSVAYDPAFSSGSARFRSAKGNRQMIETNRLRKQVSTSNFLSPDSPATGSRHLRSSVTPSPTAVHGFGGSPLKMRHNDDREEDRSPSRARARGRSWDDEARAAADEQRNASAHAEEEEEDHYEDEDDERGYYQASPRRPNQRRADLTPRTKRDIRLAAMPSLMSLGSWGRPGPRGRPSIGNLPQAGRTLSSELGSQFAGGGAGDEYDAEAAERDWEDDDDEQDEQDESYSYYGSETGSSLSPYHPHHTQGSSLIPRPSNPTDLALHSVQRALTSREAGLYLDTSTPILPPGSLAIAPPDSDTFDLLDLAVSQRPIRWAEDDDQYGVSPPEGREPAPPQPTRGVASLWDFVPNLMPKAKGDPFETDVYPEPGFPSEVELGERKLFRERRIRDAVARGEDPLSQEALRPPTRRELALQRMGLEPGSMPSSPFGTLRRRRVGGEETEEEEEGFEMVEGERGRGRKLLSAPTDGPSDWLARMRPGNVVQRVTRRWVAGVMDVWFFLQIMVVALVFMMEMMKTGRKQMKTIDRKQRREPRRIA